MTYPAFLAHFNAVGPAKGQGYFSSQFEGMSATELSQARSMMTERALGGDTIDLDGLRLIGDADTAARLTGAEPEAVRFGAQWDNVRREVLWVLTGDARQLIGCIGWLDAPDPGAQKIAAETLARLILPRDLAEVLAARLLDGKHENIVLPLTVAWLATQGVAASSPIVFQRHLPFVRSVINADPPSRRELLRHGV